tara:strand:+ start:117 stop:1160 length:1044 start_codon:yes stop_codon:yes gene_type:complete
MSTVQVDTINESTTGSGVTVDGVLIKDGSVKGSGTARKNLIINGNYDIWQRGTSFTSSGYHADRWNTTVSGTGTTTISRQAFALGQTDVPNEPKYYARISKSSGVSGATGGDVMVQRIESVRTLAGQTGTLSFYAKASESTTIDFFLKQHFGTGGSPSADVDKTPTGVSVTTSWQKFTVTQAFDSISGKTIGSNNDDYLEIIMRIDNGSNASVDFAQIQLEKGSLATDFEIRPIGEELSLCQRYFYKTFPQATTPAQNVNPGRTILLNWTGAASAANSQNFAQTMRVAPTMTFYNPYASNNKFRQWNSANDKTYTAVEIQEDMLRAFYFNGDNFTGGHQNYTADAEL